jgi:hypothetical protein
MADRRRDREPRQGEPPQPDTAPSGPVKDPGATGYGRGYDRDFGGAGRNEGFGGSWGEGHGGSVGPGDYREAYSVGVTAEDNARSFAGRGEDFGADERSWMDICADQHQRQGPHRGRGPRWTRSDERLHEAVSEHLAEDRLLDARGIVVEVEDGLVTLAGVVRSPSDRRLAEILVREVAGVVQVHNDLTVHLGAESRGWAFRPRSGPRSASLGEKDRAEAERHPGARHLPPFFT